LRIEGIIGIGIEISYTAGCFAGDGILERLPMRCAVLDTSWSDGADQYIFVVWIHTGSVIQQDVSVSVRGWSSVVEVV
jgi:hypothetical protein